MGDGSLSKHTGIYFYFFPLLFSKKFQLNSYKRGWVSTTWYLFNFPKMLLFLKKKKQHKKLYHEGLTMMIFRMVGSVCREAAAKHYRAKGSDSV